MYQGIIHAHWVSYFLHRVHTIVSAHTQYISLHSHSISLQVVSNFDHIAHILHLRSPNTEALLTQVASC